MLLSLHIPYSNIERQILTARDIPTICTISDKIYFEFFPPIVPEKTVGTVSNFDIKEIERRVDPLVGSNLYSVNHGLITVAKAEQDQYLVKELSLFYLFGDESWEPLIVDGTYAPLKDY